MVYSMTGFGRWRHVTDGWEVTVEIKSVNNRYLDCAVHAGRPLACVEDRIRPRLQELGVSRGKLDVWIGVEPPGGMDGQADDAQAQACLQTLYRLRDRWVDELMDGLSPQERQLLFERMQAMAERACAALEPLCKEEKHDQASATD